MKNKIIDCIIFNNEIELLKFRINALKNIVDIFLICESKKTFTNIDKKLNLSNYLKSNENNIDPTILDKIKIIVINDFDGLNSPWEREAYQRNYPCNYLISQNLIKSDDLVLSMDVDEVPGLELINHIAKDMNKKFIPITMWLAYFYPNYVKICGHDSEWTGPFMVRGSLMEHNGFSKYRGIAREKKLIEYEYYQRYAGWHLSYQGDEDFFKNKLNSFSHQEKSIQNKKHIKIEEITKQRKSPFDKSEELSQWAFVDPKLMGYSDELLKEPFICRATESDDLKKILILINQKKIDRSLMSKIQLIKIYISKMMNKCKYI